MATATFPDLEYRSEGYTHLSLLCYSHNLDLPCLARIPCEKERRGPSTSPSVYLWLKVMTSLSSDLEVDSGSELHRIAPQRWRKR